MARLPLRPVVFWVHLTVGAIAGAVIFVLSLTGMLLGYERQIVGALDPRGTVAVPADGVKLGLDELLARAGIPERSVSMITVRAAPDQAATSATDRAHHPAGRSLGPKRSGAPAA